MKKEEEKKDGGLPFKAANQRDLKEEVAATFNGTQKAISVISRLPSDNPRSHTDIEIRATKLMRRKS